MTTDEELVMDLALSALENLFGIPDKWTGEGGGDVAVWRLGGSYRAQQAITAIKQARAAPVQKRPQNCGTSYCSCVECVMEPAPVQEPEYWNVIDPAGNIVASETDAIRGWARIAGSYKPTVEGLLGFHDQGWRVLPKVTPPAATVQVSPLEFVTMAMEKEHLVGKPLFWAEWPNKENT